MGKKKASKTEINGDINSMVSEAGEGTQNGVGKKDSNTKTMSYEDEVANEMEELSIEDSASKKSNKKKKKKAVNSDSEEEVRITPKVGGGFAALMGDDEDDMNGFDDDDDDDDDEDEEMASEAPPSKETKNPTPPPAPLPDKGGKKSKKSKKKNKKDDDEEDLDRILAELEAEQGGGKSKEEKPKEKEESQETMNKMEEPEDPAKAKKRKKKEAQKLKQQQQQEAEKSQNKNEEPKKTTPEPPSKEATPVPDADAEAEEGDNEEESSKKKKKKKKKKGEKGDDEEEEKAKKGKPNKKMIAAMQEILAKQKEEEERLRKEEEEKLRLEEERIQQEEEARRIEEEKKERKKQKERERKERLKAEGKLLSNKQKQDQKRAQAMLEHLKAQGIDVPGIGEKVVRPGTRIRNKKNRPEDKEGSPFTDEGTPSPVPEKEQNGDEQQPEQPKQEPIVVEVEELKENWEDESEEETEEKESEETKSNSPVKSSQDVGSDNSDDEDSSDDDSENQTEAEKRKHKAMQRIDKRMMANKKNVDVNNLRAPVVCVLGHVDHGKTKILDKLRRTNVQEGEVGGITQQIGATNVPAEAIKSQCKLIRDFKMENIQFPGLLIIDTPGHESFSNLRTRGSSLCDIAILVVDITQGLEPQTIESINLLKAKKTPFLVALNKVDRVFEWESHPSKDIRDVIKLQNEPCRNDFKRRTEEIQLAFNNQGLNCALFWENPDVRSYVSLVPTSAISGDGMGNLIALICNACQTRLSQRLIFNEELQCTVLEVKTIQGHGTTIDVILVNGSLREGDTIVLAGTEGPIVTQIRSLLLPKPMKEIRVKGQYDEHKEIKAAQGVKVAAKELEKAIAGLNLKVAYHEDEVEYLRSQVDKDFRNAMKAIKLHDKGVYVQASTLGALEALLEFFKTNKVPYCGIRVGPVVKRDVMKAAAMLEHDPMYAVILAFDVKVERDAQDLADKEGVKIFSEETIYHLGDRYVEYLKDFKKKQQDEFKHIAVFPSRCKIIPTAIFNKRDPIVLGVTVESGVLKEGTPLCVPSKEFVEIGIVTSLEFDHKTVEIARKGVDVCIKIEPVPGHTPKLFGRHFEATDMLVSKISRESINACKDYFRDDLTKTDWKLMAELKKEFSIL